MSPPKHDRGEARRKILLAIATAAASVPPRRAPTHAELAERLNIHRSTVSLHVSKLQTAGDLRVIERRWREGMRYRLRDSRATAPLGNAP